MAYKIEYHNDDRTRKIIPTSYHLKIKETSLSAMACSGTQQMISFEENFIPRPTLTSYSISILKLEDD